MGGAPLTKAFSVMRVCRSGVLGETHMFSISYANGVLVMCWHCAIAVCTPHSPGRGPRSGPTPAGPLTATAARSDAQDTKIDRSEQHELSKRAGAQHTGSTAASPDRDTQNSQTLAPTVPRSKLRIRPTRTG